MMCAYWLQKPNHVMRMSEPLECILAKCQPDPPWKMIECPRKSSEANKSDFTPIFLNNTQAKSSSLSSKHQFKNVTSAAKNHTKTGSFPLGQTYV